MRKAILLLIAASLTFPAVVLAEKDRLAATHDLTYMSKYMTKGKEGYGQQGVFFETVDIDLWGTGFGTAVTHQAATGSGWVNKARFNYKVYYSGSVFDDLTYETKYKISWEYKHYYDEPRNSRNVYAWKFVSSWPKVLRPTGLTPYYISHYEYPAGSGYKNLVDHWAGWVHRFGVEYDLKTSELPQPIHLTSEIAYTDGLRAADHDFSFATFGLSTKIQIDENLAFVPGLYHQVSMDDSVCKRDVTYCILSMKYKF